MESLSFRIYDISCRDMIFKPESNRIKHFDNFRFIDGFYSKNFYIIIRIKSRVIYVISSVFKSLLCKNFEIFMLQMFKFVFNSFMYTNGLIPLSEFYLNNTLIMAYRNFSRSCFFIFPVIFFYTKC